MSFDSVIEKFNPYHDKNGRFTTADGANSVTVFTRNPEKQYLADKYKERAKRQDRVKRASKPVDWTESNWHVNMGRSDDFSERCKQIFGDVYHKAKSIIEKAEAGGSMDSDKGMLAAYEINEIVGNTGKPDVISHEKFEKLIDDGSPDMYRGFDHKIRDGKVVKSDAEKAQEFINGSKFVGSGLYGSGTYVSKFDPYRDDTGLQIAVGYAYTYGATTGGENNIVRMTATKDAVIVSGKEFSDEYTAFKTQISKVIATRKRKQKAHLLTEKDEATYAELSALDSLFSDPGCYAAARGIDGYEVEYTDGYCVIVNKGALVIDEMLLSSKDYVSVSKGTQFKKYNDHHDKYGKFCTAEEDAGFNVDDFDPFEAFMADVREAERNPDRKSREDETKRTLKEKIDGNKTERKRTPKNAGEQCDWHSVDSESDDVKLSFIADNLPDLFPICEQLVKSTSTTAENNGHGENGNEYLLLAQKEAGFKNKPLNLTSGEYAYADGTVCYRGFKDKYRGDKIVLSGDEKLKSFLSGDDFTGLGSFGDGIYASQSREVASHYSSGGKAPVLEMKVMQTAKVGDWEDICDEKDSALALLSSIKTDSVSDKVLKAASDVIEDEGTYATMRGYDAYRVKDDLYKNHMFVILNKGEIATCVEE